MDPERYIYVQSNIIIHNTNLGFGKSSTLATRRDINLRNNDIEREPLLRRQIRTEYILQIVVKVNLHGIHDKDEHGQKATE